MEDNNMHSTIEPVPYIAHEAEMARLEREHDKEREQWVKEREQHKRVVRWLCSIIIVLVLGLIGMFIYEAQFVEESWSSEASTDGGGTAVANLDGEVYYYGESESNTQNPNT